MAFPTVQSQNVLQVQRFANAVYNMQVGSVTMNQVLDDIAALDGTDEAFNVYFNFTHDTQTNAMVAETLLANFGLVAGQYGLDATEVGFARDYIIGALDAVDDEDRGAAISDIAAAYVSLAADATYGAAATAWNAEVNSAVAYTGAADLEAGSDYVVLPSFLTAGQDIWGGTGNDDTLMSDVVQNANGAQVNTLGTGDYLDGFGGIDTLQAQVTEGVFSGGGNAPIMPRTFGIENIKLEAIFSNIGFEALDLNLTSLAEDGLDLAGMPQSFIPVANDTDVYFSAKNMRGIDFIGSDHSDADLTVMDLTVDEGELTSSMTIGMAYTGNSDHVWNESDFRVYFDEDDLLRGKEVTESQAFYWLLDEDGHDATVGTANYQPLLNIDREGILFSLNGEPINIIIGELTGNDYTTAKTWEAYRDLLIEERDALVAESAIDPTFAKYAVLADVDITVSYATDDITTTNTDTLLNVPVAAIILTDNAGGVFSDLGYQRDPGATGQFDVFGQFGFDPSEDVNLLISVNVELEKVGRGGDGGELVIGGMNKTADNVWGEGSSLMPAGVEQFDVTVLGGDDLPSSLASLKSTNNALQVVNVVSGPHVTGDAADLIIGNSNTVGELGTLFGNANALKDVQTFDASGFQGDLTLFAGLTNEIVPKYLDRQDFQDDPAADNVEFVYTLGQGNDLLDLVISSDNFNTVVGTTTREDFELTINGGTGNDDIAVQIEGSATDTTPWYVNSHLNNTNDPILSPNDVNPKGYLNINGGDGNDVIVTPTAGDFVIDAGTGTDSVFLAETIFADNTAQWAINFANFPTMVSDVNNQNTGLVDGTDTNTTYDLTVTVTFNDLKATATMSIPGLGATATDPGYTDLMLNQLVKDAINNDAILGQLLVAHDGPANTLVVDALVEGLNGGTDDGILQPPAAATSVLTVGELSIAFTTENSTAVNPVSYAMVMTQTGGNTGNSSDNRVTLGTGDDLAVLGTGNVVGITDNDTLVYTAAFGNDTILNFVAVDASAGVLPGNDMLDFTALKGDVDATGTNFSNGALNLVNLSVTVMALDTAATGNDTTAKIAALYDDGSATSHIFIRYNTANVGSVFTVVDGATDGTGSDAVVTLVGTIDLADTGWATLGFQNFA